MIRFFTNYSYGGYEELYLGCYEDQEEYRYHLPLLANKKAKLANDPTNKKLADEVERLSQYVLIQKNGKTLAGTLPEGAFTIISNPGYKTICRRLGSQFVVAISDVASEDHDEMGSGKRENPFTMLFVFDKEDTNLMDVLLYQLLEKESDWRVFISSLFVYDPIANGLRFSLGALNQTIKALETIHVAGINHKVDVPMIVLEENYQLAYTLEVQKLERKTLGTVFDATGKMLRGTGLVLTDMTKPVSIPEGSAKLEEKEDEELEQKHPQEEDNKREQETTPDGGEEPIQVIDGQITRPPYVIKPSREQIKAEPRPNISKEEREKVSTELQQEDMREMKQIEMGFIAKRKKLIYIAIGVVAILLLLLTRTCSDN